MRINSYIEQSNIFASYCERTLIYYNQWHIFINEYSTFNFYSTLFSHMAAFFSWFIFNQCLSQSFERVGYRTFANQFCWSTSFEFWQSKRLVLGKGSIQQITALLIIFGDPKARFAGRSERFPSDTTRAEKMPRKSAGSIAQMRQHLICYNT